MGDLAVQFSSSFDDIVSEISSTTTYAEQEQIYKGFIKLLEQQRELLVARKDLAAKLKDSVQQEPIALNNKIKQPQLTEGRQRQQQQKQLPKAAELPMPEPQLPEIISTTTTTGAANSEEEKIKSAKISTKRERKATPIDKSKLAKEKNKKKKKE
jgi:small-conductance mechanosensitive channel